METEKPRTTDGELKIIVDQCLDVTKRYTHCVADGKIYEGNFGRPVLDFFKLTGELTNFGYQFDPYFISSGFCPNCRHEREVNRR